jgi:hypothetical protein
MMKASGPLGAAILALAQPAAAAEIPPALAAPGDAVIATLAATGVQVYECRAGEGGARVWAFKEPRAELLLDGRKVGRHFAGPTWQHDDGSAIVGKVAARADAASPSDIPWLRLEVSERRGAGAFAAAAAVQRINTRGGVASGACPEAGLLMEVPYTADYVLIGR